jgi:rhamnosyltransferase
MKIKLCAVLTAYKPDSNIFDRFRPILGCCDQIFIVDNTPGGCGLDAPDGFVVLSDGVNKGLGSALNQGISAAAQIGSDLVILFDQDSHPDGNLVNSLLELYIKFGKSGERNICIGPTHVDDSQMIHESVVVRNHYSSVKEVSCLPTSGMLLSVKTIPKSVRFSTNLFLDLVDFDFCWNLSTHNWHMYRADHINMFHRLGISERKFLFMKYHVPSPYRHYYQFRDSLSVFFNSNAPIYSRWRLVALLPIKFFVYPFILDRGLERIQWMLLGIFDYVRGIKGVGAPSIILSNK